MGSNYNHDGRAVLAIDSHTVSYLSGRRYTLCNEDQICLQSQSVGALFPDGNAQPMRINESYNV